MLVRMAAPSPSPGAGGTLSPRPCAGRRVLSGSASATSLVLGRVPGTWRGAWRHFWDGWLDAHFDPDTTTRLPTPCENQGEVLVRLGLNNSLQVLLSFICLLSSL